MGVSESSSQGGSDEGDALSPVESSPVVKSLYRHVGPITTIAGFAFDGAAGRVCVSREGTGAVEILDFV